MSTRSTGDRHPGRAPLRGDVRHLGPVRQVAAGDGLDAGFGGVPADRRRRPAAGSSRPCARSAAAGTCCAAAGARSSAYGVAAVAVPQLGVLLRGPAPLGRRGAAAGVPRPGAGRGLAVPGRAPAAAGADRGRDRARRWSGWCWSSTCLFGGGGAGRRRRRGRGGWSPPSASRRTSCSPATSREQPLPPLVLAGGGLVVGGVAFAVLVRRGAADALQTAPVELAGAACPGGWRSLELAVDRRGDGVRHRDRGHPGARRQAGLVRRASPR